jgi:MFS family permease
MNTAVLIAAVPRKAVSARANLVLFIAAVALLGMAGGMFETTFNNFLNDRFNLSAGARGMLEFPRELPGFLTALFAGLLFFLAETRIGAAAAAAAALGMLGLAWRGNHWLAMVAFMVLWSAGSHLLMPIRSSLSMALAHGEQRGKRLGEISGAGIAAGIVGCAFVWVVLRYLRARYEVIFIAGGIVAGLAAAAFACMRMPGAHLQRPKFIWRRAYWRYYALEFFYGARKQIFITFGPWVLVRVFHQPAYVFAQLWIIASVLGMVVQPLLGRAIDRFGQRTVLVFDAIAVFLVCVGYGGAHLIPHESFALALLFTCYAGDQLLAGTGMARDTYLASIAQRPEHVAPTLSLGITINHAVSMTIPTLGGLLWMRCGHGSVFMAAAVLALIMLGFALAMPRRPGAIASA